MMAEDDKRLLHALLSRTFCFREISPAVFVISPPFRAIFGRLLLHFFPNDRLWA